VTATATNARTPPIGLVNGLAETLRPFGLLEGRLSAAKLLDAATKSTGLTDFGEPPIYEPLNALTEALENEARLNFIGVLAARGDIKSVLENRLLLEEERKRNPDMRRQEIVRPLFIVGLPRAATTLFHGLLASDPENRAPLCWEVMYPFPAPGLSPARDLKRMRRADEKFKWFYRLTPGARAIHPIGARLPQECIAMMSLSLIARRFSTTYHVPSYVRWIERADTRHAYIWHQRLLQHLQAGARPRHWALKAPSHMYMLRELNEIYPDANFVLIHRDPLKVIPSLASLVTAIRKGFSDHVDPHAIARDIEARWAVHLENLPRLRAELESGGTRFVDLAFSDVMRDPIGAVERLYEQLGRTLSDEARSTMTRFLADNPKNKHGRHNYGLEDFGLDEVAARSRFDPYMERFGVRPEV